MKLTKFFKVVVVMTLFAVSVSSCIEPNPDTSNTTTNSIVQEQKLGVFGNWADAGDGVYEFVKNSATELELTYSKADKVNPEWAHAIKNLTNDLSIYKTLRFSVQGSAMIKLKIEGSKGGIEVDIAVTGIVANYEWNLMPNSEVLQGANKIIIFAAPGKVSGEGNIKFTKFEFSDSTADGVIISSGFSNIPTDVNEYNGTDETFSFNAKWQDNGDEVYLIEYVDDKTVVTYDKGKYEWSFFKSNVFGTFSNFDFITVKAKGTANNRFLFKAADGVEVTAKFSATDVVETFVLDISKMSSEQKDAIKQILIFTEPGTKEVAGTLTIVDAYFTKVNEKPQVGPETNEYTGAGETFNINRNWHDGGRVDYAINMDGTDTVITYTKSDSYSTAKTLINGNFGDFNYIIFKLKGEENKKVLLKVEVGAVNVEKNHTFTGGEDEVVMDITTLSEATRNQLKFVLLFAAPGSQTGSGTIRIIEAYFAKTAIVIPSGPIVNEYNGAGFDFNLNRNWFDGGDGVYEIKTIEGVNQFTYDKGNISWASAKAKVNGKLSDFNTINFGIKGAVGKTAILKAAGVEKLVTFTGEVQNETLDLSHVSVEDRNNIKEVLLFVEGGTENATGVVEIHWMAFKRPVASYDGNDNIFSLPLNWFDLGDNVYTITNNGSSVDVSYEKENSSYAAITNLISGDFTSFNKITFTIEGVAGTPLLLKVEGSGFAEHGITLTSGSNEYVLDISTIQNRTGLNKVLIFGHPGTSAASGSFKINSVVFSQ